MRLPNTGISNVLASVRKRSPLGDLQHDAYWMNAEAFLLTVDENAKNNGFSNSGDGDGGRIEGSQAAYVVLYEEKHYCGIVAYGSKPLTWSKSGQNSAPGGVKRKAAVSYMNRTGIPNTMTRTTGENIKRLVRKYSVKNSQMNKFGFPAEEHVQDVIHSRLKPDLETELSLEDILSKYVFVVLHDEDGHYLKRISSPTPASAHPYTSAGIPTPWEFARQQFPVLLRFARNNLQMTLSNPGHITLSAPQNTLLSWDTVEGTYERAQLTGSFTGAHPPGPSRLTPADLAPTRPNLRRFDFHTMVPPNWHLGKVNHAVDVVTPDYAYGQLHYFDNPRTDGVGYLGKKIRVKLGIGMSFADVEARGRMRTCGIRNTWEMQMHVPLVPLAPTAVTHFLLAEAVTLDLLDDPGCEVRGERGDSCGG
ncbi:hypothetical protein F5876DRAFT_65966 [Lentinula aff. lateritia]|uniref:Uncharacterized protein n=1 Tax=Lentinula aff. lateritia TaxID=2804960 RepID=A0ACC1TZX4_9AGAR|nr:hypothetical protein F5876DRAFT_65966 [Lentinula aff. lateritia]